MAGIQKITCDVCGRRFNPGVKYETLIMHVVTSHPFDLIASPGFLKLFTRGCYGAGAAIAETLKTIARKP